MDGGCAPCLECVDLGRLRGASEGIASLNGYRLRAEHACGTSFWFESLTRDAHTYSSAVTVLLLEGTVRDNGPATACVTGLRWEEFRNNAVNQGAEWLRGRLQELGAVELRSVAVAGGIRARIGDRWLPVAQLRSALMEALARTEQAQS